MIFFERDGFSINFCNVLRNKYLNTANTSLAVLEYFHESTVVLQGKY